MEEYFLAKSRLFTPAMSDRAVVNLDDERGRDLAGSGLPTITYGSRPSRMCEPRTWSRRPRGSGFLADGVPIRSALRGRSTSRTPWPRSLPRDGSGSRTARRPMRSRRSGSSPDAWKRSRRGRFLVLVDYAHTPDGVENVLRAARSLTDGRLIVVFGAGGDRDRVKRPLMGRAATANADLAVITSDNPRSEDPLQIIAEIAPGAKRGTREGGGRFVVEPDRRRAAIRLAMEEASPGDAVVIAGKGHEAYQELADRRSRSTIERWPRTSCDRSGRPAPTGTAHVIERRLSEIASAVHGTLRGSDAVASSVETDSRAVRPGDLFVAIEGERLDGHGFVGDAISRGAVAALVHRSGIDGTVIEVPHPGARCSTSPPTSATA